MSSKTLPQKKTDGFQQTCRLRNGRAAVSLCGNVLALRMQPATFSPVPVLHAAPKPFLLPWQRTHPAESETF